jgi:hypothetical protein
VVLPATAAVARHRGPVVDGSATGGTGSTGGTARAARASGPVRPLRPLRPLGAGAGAPGAATPSTTRVLRRTDGVRHATAVSSRPRRTGEQRTGDLDPLLAALAAPAPADSAAPRTLHRSAGLWTVGVVLVLVLVAAAVAWQQLPLLRGVLGIAPAAQGEPVLPTDGSGGAPAATEAQAPPAAPAPIALAGARALDPFGDGVENDDSIGGATDGDPATSWNSSTYTSAALGGLKRGVGVDLALAAEAPVSAVEMVVAGDGGTVEVRTSPDGTYENSVVAATAQVGDGEGGPVTVALPEPTPTAHVLLWFTTMPSTPEGFVVQLQSVTVR